MRRQVAILLAGLVMAVFAGTARADRYVGGDEANKNNSKLVKEIHWYQNLDEAQAVAKKQHKLIFWIHMLGKLDGCT